MSDTGTLTLLLAAAAVAIILLWNRVQQLLKDMDSKAHSSATRLFEQWKQREYDSVRRQETDLATRDAATQLEKWKLGSEKQIRKDAISRSQAVTIGKVSEHIAPYLPDFGFNPKDARFIGTPVDFIVFDGLAESAVSQVVFVEVKSSASTLSLKERQVRDAVRSGRVKWHELRVPVEAST